ncbi:MAG: GIY-YIG nuclease family protein [Patescibacteria group bacterium]
MAYYVYILECADGTLYSGSTNDIKKRVVAHNTLKTGARYTKARRPVVLKYSEKLRTKSQALKRECALKKLTRPQKLKIISVVRGRSPQRSR